MVLYTVVDAAPVVRDLCRFNVYFYQIRQLESAHDLSEAQALEQFALPALVLTDKWLGLRIERMKLRLGTHLGGSDKAAFLAVMVGAWTIWYNFPRSRSAFEQYLYMLGGAFPGGCGIAGLVVNATLARMVTSATCWRWRYIS